MNSFLEQLSILAQTPGGGVEDIIATYGPFAPFAALLLWLLKLLWADNKEKEEEIRALTTTAMDKIIPLVLEATSVLASAVTALNALKDSSQDTKLLAQRMDDVLIAIEELQLILRTLERKGRKELHDEA